jgi:ParB/RepB/Spo0J family partition protein
MLHEGDAVSERDTVPVASIVTGFNYRQEFDGIEELAASIAEVGLLQPLGVRVLDEDAGTFALVYGERRLRAVQTLGWEHVPYVLAEAEGDREASWLTLLENEQRRNPNPIEQATEYAKQIDVHGRTVAEIARAIGRKDCYVRDRLALLDCSPAVQAAVASRALPQSQALAIRDLDHNRQTIAVRDYAAHPGWTAERFQQRVDELRQHQAEEAQGSFTDGNDFMVVEVYEIEDVNPRRKIGAIGMARILERIRAEVELPVGIQPLVDKAIDDHLGEKATARRLAAHQAWDTMRREKAG